MVEWHRKKETFKVLNGIGIPSKVLKFSMYLTLNYYV